MHDDGSIPYTAEVSRLGVDYALYALFSYEGTYQLPLCTSPDCNMGSSIVLTAITGSLTLSLDRGANTGKTLTDFPNPVALSHFGDDSILGTATVVFFPGSEGHLRDGAGSANGDFGVLFDSFVLTPLGQRYFVAPGPFNQRLQLKGHFNSFEPHTNGSADVMFTP